jgi:hypothetical protein
LINLTANFAGKHRPLGETDNATSSWELPAPRFVMSGHERDGHWESMSPPPAISESAHIPARPVPLFCRPLSEFRAQKSDFCCFAGKNKKGW